MATKQTKKEKLAEDKAREAEIEVWEDRISRGEKLRKKKLKIAKKGVRYYKGMQWDGVKDGAGRSVTNLIFAHIKTRLPFLYFQNPKWYVTKKPGHKEQVDPSIAQVYLNYYANENMRITLKRQMRLSILDAFFMFGCIKVGCVLDIEMSPNQNKEGVLGEKDEKAIYDGTVDKKKSDAKPEFDIAEDGTLQDKQQEDDEVVTNVKFVARRVSPGSLIFDVECENYFEDGRFIIHELDLPLQNVKDDKKYDNTDDLEASYENESTKRLSDADLKDDKYNALQNDLRRVTIYEIYDLEHDSLKVMAKGHKKFLRYEAMPEGVDGHPFAFLQFNDIPDELYPLPEVDLLISPQDEFNKGRDIIMKHAKRFNRKYGYDESGIEAEELTKVENGEDGTFFKVKELPLAKVIEPLADAPLDISVYQNFDQSRQGFDKVSGSTESDRGNVERRKSATEAGLMGQSGNVRKEDSRSQVEDFAGTVGEKLLQSMQANLTIADGINIAGKNGIQEWVEITKDSIKGQFSVGVVVGSSTPKLPEYERQDFLQFMQSLQAFPPELIKVKVNFDGILKAISKMFPALEDIELLNDQQSQQKAQQAIDKEMKMKKLVELGKIKQGSILMPNQGNGQQ